MAGCIFLRWRRKTEKHGEYCMNLWRERVEFGILNDSAASETDVPFTNVQIRDDVWPAGFVIWRDAAIWRRSANDISSPNLSIGIMAQGRVTRSISLIQKICISNKRNNYEQLTSAFLVVYIWCCTRVLLRRVLRSTAATPIFTS
jgi:hypothetical protein